MKNNEEKENLGLQIISFAKEKIKYFVNPNEKFIKWGHDNDIPEQILSFYYNVPEHTRSIDFTNSNVMGIGLDSEMLDYWTTTKIVQDYLLFGAYAIQVIKQRNGENKLTYCDISKCRFSTDKKSILYSECWEKYNPKYETFPAINTINKEGIFIYKNAKSREVYPKPHYFSCAMSLDTMLSISEFHNNTAKSGFAPNVLINYNGGNPSNIDKANIEAGFAEKYTGTSSQKFIISYNKTKENAATIERLNGDKDDEKYKDLQKFIQNQIIISHGVTSGCLVGVKPENQGFTKTEYQESLDIFREVVIEPIRNELEYSFKVLTGLDFKFKDKTVVSDIQETKVSELNTENNGGIQ